MGGVAGLGALFTPGASVVDTYRKWRDDDRNADTDSGRVNPRSSTAGTVTGTVMGLALPGANLGQVAKGATLGAKVAGGAAVGAGYGAAAGYGGSDADDAGKALTDTAKGAAGGAVAGAALPLVATGMKKVGGAIADTGLAEKVRNWWNKPGVTPRRVAVERLREAHQAGPQAFREEAVRSAPVIDPTATNPSDAVKVAEQAMVDDAMTAVQLSVGSGAKRKMAGVRGEKFEAPLQKLFGRDKELKRTITSTKVPEKQRLAKTSDILDQRLEDLGDNADKIYATAQKYTGGVDEAKVITTIDNIADDYAKTDPEAAKYLRKEAETIAEAFSMHPAGPDGLRRMPLQDARKIAGNYQRNRWAKGNPNSPTDNAKLDGEIGRALRGALQDEVEAAAKASGDESLTTLLPKLQKTNKQLEDYLKVRKIVDEQMQRFSTGSPTMQEAMAMHSDKPGAIYDWLGKTERSRIPGVGLVGGAVKAGAEAVHSKAARERAANAVRREAEDALLDLDRQFPAAAGATEKNVRSVSTELLKREGFDPTVLSNLSALQRDFYRRAVSAGIPEAAAARMAAQYGSSR